MSLARALVDLRYHLACLRPGRPYILVEHGPLGLRFQVHKRDVVGRVLYKQGVHEPVLTAWMIERFGDADEALHFVDIGANLGYFSCLMSRLAGPSGTVAAFEPEPDNQLLLRVNLDLNRAHNVHVHPVALGAAEQSLLLHRYKGSNRGRHSFVESGGIGTIEVPVRRLDDVLGGSTALDLIKIDIEGFEPFALEGAARTLTRTRALVMEYSPALIRKAGVDAEPFLRRTASAFDRLSLVTPSGVRPSDVAQVLGFEDQVDVIFEKD